MHLNSGPKSDLVNVHVVVRVTLSVLVEFEAHALVILVAKGVRLVDLGVLGKFAWRCQCTCGRGSGTAVPYAFKLRASSAVYLLRVRRRQE
jgi:hypothetical protein